MNKNVKKIMNKNKQIKNKIVNKFLKYQQISYKCKQKQIVDNSKQTVERVYKKSKE